MAYTKKKIIVISDLEHSKPRIPNLLFHLNKDHYEKYIIGANSEAKIYEGDYPEDFFQKVNLLNFERSVNLFKSIKNKTRTFNTNKLTFFNTIKKLIMKVVLEFLFPDQYFFTANQYIKLFNENFNPKKDTIILVSSSPYPTVHYAASKIKRIYKNDLHWIADYRDLWSLNHFYNKSFLRKKIESNYEKRILKSADLITTVSNELARKQSKFLNKKVETIYNGYSENNNESNIDLNKYLEPGKLNIIYTGSLYLDYFDMDGFLKSLISINKDIVFHFYGNFSPLFQNKIDMYNLGEIVKQMGLLSNLEILKLQKNYDYLLFFDVNYDVKGLYSLKFYEYIKSLRPIICIGKNQLSSIKKTILEENRGLIFNQEKDLVRFLNNNSRPPENLDSKGISKFSYKNQSIKLDLEINKLLNK